jgi:hypothetical protein
MSTRPSQSLGGRCRRPLAVRIDGHCPDCHAASTFSRTAGQLTRRKGGMRSATEGVLPSNYSYFELTCARREDHKIRFWFKFNGNLIEKVGQYPSLADIANDESRLYKAVLKAEDGAELRKAIGLAAHGIGVGSFVYLRRVFERLIKRRFLEFQQQEGWENADFDRKRMDEKIDFLKDHLPDFLVRNKNIYAILSLGLHELEESACLDAFEMLKHAIFFILNEDKHKKEELQLRKKLESAISSYSTKVKS